MVHRTTRLQSCHQACARKDPHSARHAVITTRGRLRTERQCRYSTSSPVHVYLHNQNIQQLTQRMCQKSTRRPKEQDGTVVQHPEHPETTRRLYTRMEAGSTGRIKAKARNPSPFPWLTCCRAPWERQHHHSHNTTLLVARNEQVGGMLHHWVHTMPTEQNMHYQEENPPILHPRRPLNVPLQHHCPRSHYPIAQCQWTRCHTHHCQSRVLQGGNLPPMQNNNHWRRNSPPLSPTSLSLVQSPIQSHLWPGSTLHLTLRQGTNLETKDRAKY